MFSGLVYKQARTVALIALALGLVSALLVLTADWRAERRTLRTTTQQFLAMVNGSAAEAAFQMNSELSQDLAKGLLHYEAVRSVTLRDNFGTQMAHLERAPGHHPLSWLADRLFEGVTDYSLPLVHHAPDGRAETVGELEVRLDAGTVAGGFFERVVLSMGSILAQVVGISLLLVGAFYWMITKPLLKVTVGVARVDPARPGETPLAVPPRHEGDELGLLVHTLNRLLGAFQSGLAARDEAEGKLTDLARTLEERVDQRTLELEREKEGVERALAQLNAAHAELNKVNRRINESIRYASRIQSSLLPDAAALPELFRDIAVGWQPRDVVGGDFYWIGRFAGRCLVAVMDCTGHGVPGAFMTAIAASVLDRILHEHCHDDPAQILQLLNRLIKASLRQDGRDQAPETVGSDDGLDAAVCLVDEAARSLTFAGANIPLLYARGGVLHEIKGDRHSLGYRSSQADFNFSNHVIMLEEGMAFYLATDGVTDQVGGDHRRLFGRRRLRHALEGGLDLPMERQMERLFAILADYRGGESRRDDLTFIGFTPL